MPTTIPPSVLCCGDDDVYPRAGDIPGCNPRSGGCITRVHIHREYTHEVFPFHDGKRDYFAPSGVENPVENVHNSAAYSRNMVNCPITERIHWA